MLTTPFDESPVAAFVRHFQHVGTVEEAKDVLIVDRRSRMPQVRETIPLGPSSPRHQAAPYPPWHGPWPKSISGKLFPALQNNE